MKISIQTLGGFGDVMPFITVAKRLRKGGADVSILAPRDYIPTITAEGLTGMAAASFTLEGWMAESAERGTLKNPINFFRDWSEMIRPHVDEVMETCLSAADGADLVLANTVCAPARLAAAAHGLPFILNAHQPVISPSRDVPCAMAWRPWMGSNLNRTSYMMVDIALRLMDRALKRQRDELGLKDYPAFRDLNRHLDAPLEKVTSISPALLGRKPGDWTSNDHLMPYPSLVSDADSALPADVVAFAKAGPPPLYFGLGSMELDVRELPVGAIDAALLSTGNRAFLSKNIAAQMEIDTSRHFVLGSCPHDLLFPLCGAIIHHGGAGTLDTALRAGRPQIILPHYLDQFWHAHRLQQLGIAPRPIEPTKFSADDLKKAIAFTTQDSTRQMAETLAAQHRGADGVSQLTQLIFDLAGGG